MHGKYQLKNKAGIPWSFIQGPLGMDCWQPLRSRLPPPSALYSTLLPSTHLAAANLCVFAYALLLLVFLAPLLEGKMHPFRLSSGMIFSNNPP